MRIGINALGLQPRHNGGAESVFLNLVKGFEKSSIKDKIIYFCYPEMEKAVKNISPQANVVVVDDCVDDRHARVSINKIQTTIFHRIYKKYSLDVLLFVNADIGLLKYNIPVILLPHDIQNVSRPEINKNKLEYYLNYWSYKISFRYADRIIAISDVDKEEIVKNYPFTSNRIIKIYDPIDVDKKDIDIVGDKEDFILAVNIQYKHKNIITLLKAFSLICNKNSQLKLKLVGAHSGYTAQLVDYVEKNGLVDKVEFLGFVSKDRLIDIWKHARLYVNPSLYEGFGMTSVESMLYGAPTLLGDLQVNREVTDNMCRYYKDLENEKELASSMQELLSLDYDIQSYKDKANRLVERYKIETICNQYISIMKQLTE